MTLMTHEQRVEAKAREIQERLGILNRQRKPQRRRRLAVKCLDLDREFPSMTAAAAEVHRSTAAISLAIRNKHRSAGYRWELIGETYEQRDAGSVAAV